MSEMNENRGLQPAVLTLEYIKANTMVELQFEGENRSVTCLYKDVGNYTDGYIPEFDKLVKADPFWQNQELKPFWIACWRAKNFFHREDIVTTEDFYAEWVRDPSQFDIPIRPVIGDLETLLKDPSRPDEQYTHLYFSDGTFLTAKDKRSVVEALEEIGGPPFDVVEIKEKRSEYTPDWLAVEWYIQCYDYDRMFKLHRTANRIMMDRKFGPLLESPLGIRIE